ncbi:MAG: DMT family transporter [Melioribacteraceae bacterium]|nr:DMT family transporter [Melioribacteraceae bacterium]
MKDKYTPLFVIIAASLWGVDGIVLTPNLYTLPVPLVVLLNSAVVSVLLIPFIYKHFPAIKNLSAKDYFSFVGVAIFGGAIGTMAITKALFYVNYVNLSIVMLIQKLQPLFAIILASIVLKEKLSAKFFLWGLFAIAGAYLMTFGINLPDLDTGDKTLMAASFALLAAVSFGSSTVFSKRALKNTGFELGTYLRFLFTAIIMLVIVSVSGDYNSISEISDRQIIIFLLIACTTGAPAIFLYYYGLKKISASSATIYELAFPLTAVILEYFLRGKLLNSFQWIGVLILVFSIVKVTRLNNSNKK